MRSSNACRVRRTGLGLRAVFAAGGMGALGAIGAVGLAVAISAGPAGAEASAARGPSSSAAANAGADAPSAAGSTTAPPNLAALLEAFRTMPGFEARFEEEKTLALLAVPLKSRGRIYFSPPATLLRRVEAPDPHDILIREQVVRIARPRAGAAASKRGAGAPIAAGAARTDRDVETIDLARRDDVRPLVESMVWLFAGDLARLESVYRIAYHAVEPAASGRWQLELVPRAEPLSRLVRALEVAGRGHAAEALVVTEATGDRTTTRILEADAARRFAAGELEALFGTGAP